MYSIAHLYPSAVMNPVSKRFCGISVSAEIAETLFGSLVHVRPQMYLQSSGQTRNSTTIL